MFEVDTPDPLHRKRVLTSAGVKMPERLALHRALTRGSCRSIRLGRATWCGHIGDKHGETVDTYAAVRLSRLRPKWLTVVLSLGGGPHRCRTTRRHASSHLDGGRAASFEELEDKGLEFWVNAKPAAKLQAMWDAIVEAWVINGKHGPPPRLQGSAFGVRRHER